MVTTFYVEHIIILTQAERNFSFNFREVHILQGFWADWIQMFFIFLQKIILTLSGMTVSYLTTAIDKKKNLGIY